MTEERIHKRLVGTARYWQRRFHVKYEFLPDLIQSAWVGFLQHPSLDTETKFNGCHSYLRRVIIRELFGYIGKNADIKNRQELKFVPPVDDTINVEFDNRVLLREIIALCAEPSGHRNDHLTTISRIDQTGKNMKNRRTRLRAYLKENNVCRL